MSGGVLPSVLMNLAVIILMSVSANAREEGAPEPVMLEAPDAVLEEEAPDAVLEEEAPDTALDAELEEVLGKPLRDYQHTVDAIRYRPPPAADNS